MTLSTISTGDQRPFDAQSESVVGGEFDLSAYLSLAVEVSDDLQTMARWAWDNVPAEHAETLALAALPTLIRNHIGKARRGTKPSGPTSSKWADAGTIYKRYLSAKISVGEGQMKVFGDCNRDDVFNAAAVRFEHAERTRTEGLRFKAFHDAMVAHDAELVSDLPEVVVVEIIRQSS